MPLERQNHYGHLLVPGAPEQPIKTVHFPSYDEAAVRRQMAREAFAARTMAILFVATLAYGIYAHDDLAYVGAAVNFVCFWIVCFVAGSRVGKRRLGQG